MNLDFEDQLRADLAAVEAPLRPGLAQHAFRGHRTRQKARRRGTAAAAGCAVAAAGVATGLSLTAAPAPQTTAVLVDQVTSALQSSTAISYATVTGFPGARLIQTWAYGDQTRSRRFAASTGKPVADVSTTTTSTEQHVTAVSYLNRTWAKFSSRVWPAPSEKCGSFDFAFNLATSPGQQLNLATSLGPGWKTVIADALKCGGVTVVDNQRIDGQPVTKLETHAETGPSANSFSIDVILWIDPATYLPVRSVDRQTETTAGRTTSDPAVTTIYHWLPATKSNLADLSTPVPPGFTKAVGGISLPGL